MRLFQPKDFWEVKDTLKVLDDSGVKYELIGFSDYSGSLVDRANYEYIKENLIDGRDYFFTVENGSYRSEEICLVYNQHTHDLFVMLGDYPLFDDDLYNELQNELVNETIEDLLEEYNIPPRFSEEIAEYLYGCSFLPYSIDFCVEDLLESIGFKEVA